MRAFKTLTLIMVMALVACGGGADTADTTVATDGTTSTIAVETTVTTAASDDGDAGTVDLDDMPAECIDVFVSLLQAMEPALEGFDFETATADDMEAMATELESVTTDYESDIENLNCPDVDTTDEEAFAAMIEIAEREAPGTVAYLEWVQSFASAGDTAGSASGDCETDIAALEALVDANASVGDLTMDQIVEVGGLVSSISIACTPERADEFLSQEKVANFLEG